MSMSQLVCSGSEDVDCPDNVLTADGTLIHPLATLCARDHVTTLQQDTVDWRVHTNFTEVLLQADQTTISTMLYKDKLVIL